MGGGPLSACPDATKVWQRAFFGQADKHVVHEVGLRYREVLKGFVPRHMQTGVGLLCMSTAAFSCMDWGTSSQLGVGLFSMLDDTQPMACMQCFHICLVSQDQVPLVRYLLF